MLIERLMEAGKDIWEWIPPEHGGYFFERLPKRALWQPHQLRQRENIGWTDILRDSKFQQYRAHHEIGHLVCCRDENVMNPFWDFNHFIDTEGKFSNEQALLEVEVIVVQAILQQDEIRHIVPIMPPQLNPPSADAMIEIHRHTTEGQGAGIPRRAVEAEDKWTLQAIEAEALRKYELIRRLKRNE